MENLRIDLDYERLASALRPQTPQPWFAADKLLPRIQIIALLVAGIWGLYIYISFQRQSNKISLALLNSQQLQAETQKLIGQLTIEQVKVSLVKESIEVQKRIGGQTVIEHSMEVQKIKDQTRVAPARYLVSYHYALKNQSDTPREVVYVAFEVFRASIPVPAKSQATLLNEVDEPGPLKWGLLFRQANVYPPRSSAFPFVILPTGPLKPKVGGSGTGKLNSGEYTAGSLEFVLTAQPYDCVQVVQHALTDSGGGYTWRIWNNACMFQAKEEQSGKSGG